MDVQYYSYARIIVHKTKYHISWKIPVGILNSTTEDLAKIASLLWLILGIMA